MNTLLTKPSTFFRLCITSAMVMATMAVTSPAYADDKPKTPSSKIKASAARLAKAATPRSTRASKSSRQPKLSREWVWHKKAITFDSMYRQKKN